MMFAPRHIKRVAKNATVSLINNQKRAISSSERDALCLKLNVHPSRVPVTIEETRAKRKEFFDAGKTVGMVPTMGALHEGHLSLLNQSKIDNDITVGSVFVNAGQFAPHEDLDKYPRTLEDDLRNLFEQGCEFVFTPSPEVMYPRAKPGATAMKVQSTFVIPSGVDARAGQEGSARPGFFTGVATVVTKLFNIVQPTNAYFGQKDGLQTIVVRGLVEDLNINTNVVVCPTIREADGLAMSSRNVYLTPAQRSVAPALYAGLQNAKKAYMLDGNRSYEGLRKAVLEVIEREPAMKVEYVSVCDALTANEMNEEGDVLPEGHTMMVSAAVSFGTCRILDNILIE